MFIDAQFFATKTRASIRSVVFIEDNLAERSDEAGGGNRTRV
jgi:hypothetical protein